MRAICIAAVLLLAAGAQALATAHAIYQRVSPSVLELYLKSGDQFLSQGTGFVISDDRIVTNAHVVGGGTPFVQLGPARIAAKLVREDTANDLAILTVAGDLGAPALTLAVHPPSPGDPVFVVGNPEGLTNSISAGMVAAVRHDNGADSLQITAPISHGSSGSPVVNAAGQVVGVVVSTLSSGQNLNFAVPAAVLRSLLAGNAPTNNFDALLARAQALQAQLGNTGYSDAPDSVYQRLSTRVSDAFARAAHQAAGNADELHRLFRVSENTSVARAEVAARPDSTSDLDLAYALEMESQMPNASPDGLSGALAAVNAAIVSLPQPAPGPYVEKGQILNESKLYDQADAAFSQALDIDPDLHGDLEHRTLAGLADADFNLGRYAQSAAWFDKLNTSGLANAYDWSGQGKRLEAEHEPAAAAQARQTAASDSQNQLAYEDWANAAFDYSDASQPDAELNAARQCVAAAPDNPEGKASAETCHAIVARVLDMRGVYASALEEATAAISLAPSDGWAFDAQAQALDGLHRYTEAVSAEQTAISLTDGKYSSMQFELGSIYFDQEDWTDARDAYSRAAAMDTTNSAAVYNIALCDQNLKDYSDSLDWYREALRRDPNTAKKDDINRAIAWLENLLGG